MKEIRVGFAILSLMVTSQAALSGESHTVAGGALYLLRHGYETHRAEFDYAADCRFVAKTMNKVEPQVEWYCDTSTSPIKFECSISGIEIRNLDLGEDNKIDIDFSLSLDRGVARALFSKDKDWYAAANSFNYTRESGYFKLINNYPYVSGNWMSRAITQVWISHQDGSVNVTDINGERNGKGKCRLVEG